CRRLFLPSLPTAENRRSKGPQKIGRSKKMLRSAVWTHYLTTKGVRRYLGANLYVVSWGVSQAFQPVSDLLVRWRAGDQQALQDLIPLVYEELRQIARRQLQGERPGHTLQSAALVHEAYLRLIEQRPFDTRDRAHFLAVAARLMRQVLVDHARRNAA